MMQLPYLLLHFPLIASNSAMSELARRHLQFKIYRVETREEAFTAQQAATTAPITSASLLQISDYSIIDVIIIVLLLFHFISFPSTTVNLLLFVEEQDASTER